MEDHTEKVAGTLQENMLKAENLYSHPTKKNPAVKHY